MKNIIEKEELINMYNDMLNECYLGIFGLLPATILEECDPIAYNCGLNDYYDSLTYEDYYCKDME